jgi:hypothetical protein
MHRNPFELFFFREVGKVPPRDNDELIAALA